MSVEENKGIQFILASASPRRRDVFSLLRLDFKILAAKGVQEEFLEDPVLTVEKNSIKKAKAVLNYVKIDKNYTDTVICGFDTVVYFENRYYGKPKDAAQASCFLKELSGKTHDVYSGVCLISRKSQKQVTGWEKTQVKFRDLDAGRIDAYLGMEDVFDKAAGYNIAGAGAVLVQKVCGCFFNVVGLPVYRFTRLLEELEYKF
jgi:septum formation protein